MDIEHVRDMLDIAASGVVSQEILCSKHRGRILRSQQPTNEQELQSEVQVDEGSMFDELMGAGLPVGTVALELEHATEGSKRLRSFDSCGNVRTFEAQRK